MTWRCLVPYARALCQQQLVRPTRWVLGHLMFVLRSLKARVLCSPMMRMTRKMRKTTTRRKMMTRRTTNSTMSLGCLSSIEHRLVHSITTRYFKQLLHIYVTNLGTLSANAYKYMQGTSYTQQFRWVPRQRDRKDVGFTPNVLPLRPKRQWRPRYPYTPGEYDFMVHLYLDPCTYGTCTMSSHFELMC